MMISKIIMDIVELKQAKNLLESNWTFEGQVDWLLWAIPMGLVVTKYEGDKLVGYLEYVRVSEVPVDINHIVINYYEIKTAPIGLVTNMIADSIKTILELKNIALSQNKDDKWFMLVWHNKKTNTWRTFKRRSKDAE